MIPRRSRIIGACLLAITLVGGYVVGTNQHPAQAAEGFVFIEQYPSFTSASPASSSTLYIHDKGLVQHGSRREGHLLSLTEGVAAPTGLSQVISIKNLVLPKDKLGQDPEATALSEWHPACVKVVLQRADGSEFHWYGSTNAMSDQLLKLVDTALLMGAKMKTSVRSGARCYLRADLLDDATIQEFQQDGRFKNIDATKAASSLLCQALDHPFRLIPVPEGVNGAGPRSERGRSATGGALSAMNPFAPFYTQFKAGESRIEISRAGRFYQVMSFSTEALTIPRN